MKDLVKDGKILLDGTKLINQKHKFIQSIEKKLGIPLEIYFKLFEQDYVYAYDNNFCPHVNNLITIDTILHSPCPCAVIV